MSRITDKHALALVDAKGAVQDQVRFEVRGAFEKPKMEQKGKRGRKS